MTDQSTVENDQLAKLSPRMKLLIEENSKLQEFIVYPDGIFTKDQTGWSFTLSSKMRPPFISKRGA